MPLGYKSLIVSTSISAPIMRCMFVLCCDLPTTLLSRVTGPFGTEKFEVLSRVTQAFRTKVDRNPRAQDRLEVEKPSAATTLICLVTAEQ